MKGLKKFVISLLGAAGLVSLGHLTDNADAPPPSCDGYRYIEPQSNNDDASRQRQTEKTEGHDTGT